MLTKELKSLIDKYCMGKEPTDAQLDQIMDLAISLNADSLEVANYIEEKQNGPTQEELDRIAKAEADRKAKAEAERKAKEEAIRKAKARQDITYTLSITGVQNRLQAMITLRALYGLGAADSKRKLAKLPMDIATTKSKNDALEKLKKLNAGGVIANVLAVNALDEIIDLKK